MEGKPVAGAVVEVEYYNKEGRYAAPNEYFVTQSVLTDADGVFTYAVPWAGWWGFAALNTAPEKIDYNGEKKDLELGAVLWTEFLEPMKK
jgi:cobalt/nickel transport protein